MCCEAHSAGQMRSKPGSYTAEPGAEHDKSRNSNLTTHLGIGFGPRALVQGQVVVMTQELKQEIVRTMLQGTVCPSQEDQRKEVKITKTVTNSIVCPLLHTSLDEGDGSTNKCPFQSSTVLNTSPITHLWSHRGGKGVEKLENLSQTFVMPKGCLELELKELKLPTQH